MCVKNESAALFFMRHLAEIYQNDNDSLNEQLIGAFLSLANTAAKSSAANAFANQVHKFVDSFYYKQFELNNVCYARQQSVLNTSIRFATHSASGAAEIPHGVRFITSTLPQQSSHRSFVRFSAVLSVFIFIVCGAAHILQ